MNLCSNAGRAKSCKKDSRHQPLGERPRARISASFFRRKRRSPRSRSGRAFGPTWISWIVCVCLRTASVEWNVPGKYGPHGELFFFFIQKELATMPGNGTLSPFLATEIRTQYFSADVLKKCARIALHFIAEEG